MGNLPSKFEDARPLGSRIIRYVRDERTTIAIASKFNHPDSRMGAIDAGERPYSSTYQLPRRKFAIITNGSRD